MKMFEQCEIPPFTNIRTIKAGEAWRVHLPFQRGDRP